MEVLSASLSQYVLNLIVTFLATISNLELRNMYLIWMYDKFGGCGELK